MFTTPLFARRMSPQQMGSVMLGDLGIDLTGRTSLQPTLTEPSVVTEQKTATLTLQRPVLIPMTDALNRATAEASAAEERAKQALREVAEGEEQAKTKNPNVRANLIALKEAAQLIDRLVKQSLAVVNELVERTQYPAQLVPYQRRVQAAANTTGFAVNRLTELNTYASSGAYDVPVDPGTPGTGAGVAAATARPGFKVPVWAYGLAGVVVVGGVLFATRKKG